MAAMTFLYEVAPWMTLDLRRKASQLLRKMAIGLIAKFLLMLQWLIQELYSFPNLDKAG